MISIYLVTGEKQILFKDVFWFCCSVCFKSVFYCVFSKKTSPARRDSSTSGQRLTQGKISDYVKPKSKPVSRTSSRHLSEDSAPSSSKNGPTAKQSSSRQRVRDSSEESSGRRQSPAAKQRRSSLSSGGRSSSSPAKKSTTVNR